MKHKGPILETDVFKKGQTWTCEHCGTENTISSKGYFTTIRALGKDPVRTWNQRCSKCNESNKLSPEMEIGKRSTSAPPPKATTRIIGTPHMRAKRDLWKGTIGKKAVADMNSKREEYLANQRNETSLAWTTMFFRTDDDADLRLDNINDCLGTALLWGNFAQIDHFLRYLSEEIADGSLDVLSHVSEVVGILGYAQKAGDLQGKDMFEDVCLQKCRELGMTHEELASHFHGLVPKEKLVSNG